MQLKRNPRAQARTDSHTLSTGPRTPREVCVEGVRLKSGKTLASALIFDLILNSILSSNSLVLSQLHPAGLEPATL
jgi:hypothetical protein